MAVVQKITNLTEEQTKAIPVVRDLWIEIGLSTQRVDFERAKVALAKTYECGNTTAASGTVGTKGATRLKMPANVQFARGPNEGFEVFKRETGSSVLSEYLDGLIFGSQDASWLSMYDFYHRFCGIDLSGLAGLWDLARESGWCYVGDTLAIVMDRPLHIKMDEDKRLHCENGAAIEYADGTKVYAWHGQRIPGDWIEHKDQLTAAIALTWENVEQRRAACEILGWNHILKELNARVIEADEDPTIGVLLEVDIPDIGTERFIRVLCGTGREFALPVPPDMQTALQANAWTYGMSADEYKPEIRT